MARKTTETVNETEVRRYKLKSLMNVRARPSLASERLDVMEKGSIVEVVAIEEGWLRLRDGNYIFFDDGRYAVEV